MDGRCSARFGCSASSETFLLGGGEFDGDGGTVGLEVLRIDVAVVLFDRAVAHAQAQPRALAYGLGGVKGIEDAVQIAESGARVAEAHDHSPGFQVSFDNDFLFRSLLDG